MHVEFGAWLGEREIAGAKTYRGRAEERARKFRQHALEMSHRDSPALVDHEAFDLREHRRSAHRQIVAPVASPRAHDGERRPPLFHHADLAVRGMRPQQHAALDVKRVLHVARRMMRLEVERCEVVKVVLDILGHRHFEAHRFEDLQHLLEDVGNRMDVAARDAHAGQRHVEALLVERLRQRGDFDFFSERLDARFDFALDLVDQLADGGALRIRHLAHPAHDFRQLAGAAEYAHAHRVDLRLAGVVAEFSHRTPPDFFELFFHHDPQNISAMLHERQKQKTTWAVTPHGLLVRGAFERPAYAAFKPSALLAVRTSSVNNASRSCASFASILRSTSTPAFFNPSIRLLYEIPFSRASALMRAIHSVR